MGMSFGICLVVLVLVYGCIEATDFRTCNDGPSPLAVRVTGCQHEPCPMKRRTSIHVEVDFVVRNDSTNLAQVMLATVGTIVQKAPLGDEANVCKHLANGYCPVDQNEHLTYILEMPIYAFEPQILVDLNSKISDDFGTTLACFNIKIQVI